MLKLEIYCSIGFMVGNSSTSRMEALSEWSLSDRLNLIQRNFVFRSKGNLAKQIGWYVLAFCVITCIAFVGMLFLFRPVACRCNSMHFF